MENKNKVENKESQTPLDRFNSRQRGSALDNFIARKRYVESGQYASECEGARRIARRIAEEESI